MTALFVIVTIAKLALASVWGATSDISNMQAQASAFLAGADVLDFHNTAGNPSYFPMGHYALASAALLLSRWTMLPFSFLIKVPAILADLVVARALQLSPRAGTRVALAYLLNPVSFLLSVYHGQLHTVAVAGMVLALIYADRDRWMRGGVWLGLGASVRQHAAVALLPLLFRAGARWRWLAVGFVATVLALNVPLLSSPRLAKLGSPNLYYGAWGYCLVLMQLPRLLHLWGWSGAGHLTAIVQQVCVGYGAIPPLVWTCFFCGWVWQRHTRLDSWHATLLYVVGLYSVSAGFGVQWLIWALPFWLVVNRRHAIVYSCLAGGFLAGSYWQWSLNAHYGVVSLTANLHLLNRVDLVGVVCVGLLGVLTWIYCVRATWRLVHER